MEERRILLAVTGGIAAYKTPELVRALRRAGHTVRCAMTRAAAEFVSPLALQTVSGHAVRRDLFDAAEEGQIDHIALADWAELVIVAPATAHALARFAAGLADDLVTTVVLATRAPLLLAPAMNVNMWRHPATARNVAALTESGAHWVGPDTGELACGWEGEGRMSDPARIAQRAQELLAQVSRSEPQASEVHQVCDLAGVRVLVTAGGTREPIDPVRFLGNRSSGKMGFAVARRASQRGAEVVLVSGPTVLATPSGVRRIDVGSALEMREAVLREFARADVVVKAAAVADFRPVAVSDRKIRKEDLAEGTGIALELVRNPDILAELCRAKGSRVIVGFAAESEDVIAAARRKIARKGCDLLVANDVSAADSGFDVDRNTVSFVWPGGDVESLPPLGKDEVADRLLDRVAKLLGARE
ncbi:MAG TPA: bifunctional phosphopantothenoylcysteine decarboxylase/phosphopantothenate--cysteine ligase CoaBC [Myxococcota bacterium]|nr:bifunctional phosphopantothenoylcysteine decarboxylase/phosphopantothenate--cysteine ligase CoaBC [Myxococcota bacterium]